MPDNDIRAVDLIADASRMRLSRREIIKRGLAMGLSVSTIGWVLAACGSSNKSTTTSGGSSGSGSTATSASGGTTATSSSSGTPASGGSTSTQATGGTPISGGTFTALFGGTIADFDPQSAYDSLASCAFFGTYEMLIRLKGNSTFDYQPMLAKEWGPNSDGSEWTFTLYDNIKFHDGSVCDAAAVVFSFQRLLKMGRGPHDVVGRFVDNPDTDITAVDSKTVKFKLKTPNPIFEAAIASQYGPFVVSKDAVEKNKTADDEWAHQWFVKNMVGTGPYKVTSIDQNQQIVLEKFPDYYRGWDGNHFDKIVMRIVEDTATRRQLIEGGSADALTNSLNPQAVEDLRKNAKLQVVDYPTTNANWTTMNYGDRLADADARTGFCYAFPYDEVRQGVYKGLLDKSGGPLTPTTAGYDKNIFIYETDLNKAKELIGKKFNAGEKFSWMFSSGDELSKQIAQLMQANLQKIGYDLDIREVERATETDLAYGDSPPDQRPDFFGDWGWWPDYNDGYNEIYPNFYSKSAGSAGANAGFYKNDRVDEILDTIAPGVSEADYNKLMAECQNILVEKDPGAIYWGAVRWYTILGADVRGFEWNPIYLNTYYFYDMFRVKM